jgi:hypothetical protein
MMDDVAGSPGEVRDRPADRYGTPRRWPAGLVALGVAGVLLMGAVVWLAAGRLAAPVTAHLVSYGVPTPTAIEATIDVTRDAGVAVTCTLFAVDEYFQVAGQRDVEVPPEEPSPVRVTTVIETLGQARAVRLDGCRAG